jgi:uncharacterized protein (TIGR01777 family)
MSGRVMITGVTGFIGQAVARYLAEKNYSVAGLTRDSEQYKGLFSKENISLVTWDAESADGWQEYAEGAKLVINLAGENIGSGIWTAKRKQKLLDSRIKVSSAVVEAINNCKDKPECFIQASAVGYYGSRGDEELTEESSRGIGFLSTLCEQWERTARQVDQQKTRLVFARLGNVLGEGGGLLSKLELQFKLFMGGYFGSGKQWISWIARQDICRAVEFFMNHETLSGVFNLTSPEPVRSKDFYKLVGKKLNRPAWLKYPEYLLKLFLRDMGEETLLASQKVLPARLLKSGFQFRYAQPEAAFEAILNDGR